MFSFLQAFWLLLDWVLRLLPSCVICCFSLLPWRIFRCQIPFLYLDSIFPKFVLGFPILFVFGKQFDTVHVHQLVDLFLQFTEFASAVHFLRMLLSGIIAISNSNDDSASPCNMRLGIFTSTKLFLRAVNFTLQVSMVFLVKFTIWSVILYILK